MAGRKPNVMTAIVLVGLAASLMFLYQARAGLRERDEQVRRLRDRTAHLEGEVARPSFTAPFGLTAGDRDAYLSLGYKEFDATSGSGHRRLRDQPQSPARAGELIEAYLERHPELPPDQWVILEFHAAQLFAMGGINELAITHIDRARRLPGADVTVLDATKAFLLLDREGLLAARRPRCRRPSS